MLFPHAEPLVVDSCRVSMNVRIVELPLFPRGDPLRPRRLRAIGFRPLSVELVGLRGGLPVAAPARIRPDEGQIGKSRIWLR